MSRSAPTNVKLTDFGTARAVTLSITKATQMTVGLGTPIYMVRAKRVRAGERKSEEKDRGRRECEGLRVINITRHRRFYTETMTKNRMSSLLQSSCMSCAPRLLPIQDSLEDIVCRSLLPPPNEKNEEKK